MENPLMNDLDRFLAELKAEQEAKQQTPHPEEASSPQDPEEEARPTVHVYLVDDEDLPPVPATHTPTMESTSDIPDPVFSPPPSPDTDATVPLTYPMSPRRLVLILALVALIGLLVGSAWYVVPLLVAPTATLTIIAQSQMISASTTITIVPHGAPDPAHKQVPGRMLSTLTLSQDKTIPTTGTGHQQARAAQGWITLYNALPQVQTVPAGTLLTGADGVQVVTEQDGVIPAGSLSTNGQVSVPARAMLTGPAGNIAARDLYGSCCRVNVFAQNLDAFTGGQDARSFPMVSPQDVTSSVSTLKAALDQSVQAALSTQVHPDETLVTPVACTPQASTDQLVGEEASRVHITVNETCTGEVYPTQAVHALVVQVVQQQATKRLGTGYTLSGEVTERMEQSSTRTDRTHGGTIHVPVQGTGIWTAQFTQGQVQGITTLIAGMPKQDAVQRVLGLSGVKSVSIRVDGHDETTLPSDPQRIHVLIVSEA